MKKKRVEDLVQSQKGALDKFITSSSKQSISKNTSDKNLASKPIYCTMLNEDEIHKEQNPLDDDNIDHTLNPSEENEEYFE